MCKKMKGNRKIMGKFFDFGIRKILSCAVCAGVILTGCGKVEQVSHTDEIPDLEVSQYIDSSEEDVDVSETEGTEDSDEETTETGKSKKRSGHDATGTATESVTTNVTTTATGTADLSRATRKTTDLGEIPVITPPSGEGRVVENPNKPVKTTQAQAQQTSTVTTTAAFVATDVQVETETEPTETTRTVPENPTPQELLDYMTIEEKICQMFIVTPEQVSGYQDNYAGEETKNGIDSYPVGGIIYSSKHFNDWGQTMQMLENTQNYAKERCGAGIFTAVDEEGGTIARVADTLGTASFEDMSVYGELNDADTAYNIGSVIGTDLKNLGFNVDFAPVADIAINENNELGGRIFSSDPEVVANMANNVAMGLQSAGVCATMKHFPGLGAEDGNTHEDSAVYINRTLEQLRAEEFVPFKRGIDSGVDFIMVGHQIVSGIGDGLPADLSYTAVTGILRNELGFNGIIVTDSHQMNTICGVYGSGDSAVMAVQAGVDIILMPDNMPSAVEGLCNAVKSGQISESRIDDSVYRILNQKYELGLL